MELMCSHGPQGEVKSYALSGPTYTSTHRAGGVGKSSKFLLDAWTNASYSLLWDPGSSISRSMRSSCTFLKQQIDWHDWVGIRLAGTPLKFAHHVSRSSDPDAWGSPDINCTSKRQCQHNTQRAWKLSINFDGSKQELRHLLINLIPPLKISWTSQLPI